LKTDGPVTNPTFALSWLKSPENRNWEIFDPNPKEWWEVLEITGLYS
jgi:hypothetical protein